MGNSCIQLIGVEISRQFIAVCKFVPNTNSIQVFSVELLAPFMPGLVTVTLCDQLLKIVPEYMDCLIGVSCFGQVDNNGRISISSPDLTGWVDVPLADWLEIRLRKKVNLFTSETCRKIGEAWMDKHNKRKEKTACALGACLLAYEETKGFL